MTTRIVRCDRCGERIDRGQTKLVLQYQATRLRRGAGAWEGWRSSPIRDRARGKKGKEIKGVNFHPH
jgi:hypothetical protein